MNKSPKVYYKFKVKNSRVEFHVSSVAKEIERGEAVSRSMPISSPDFGSWFVECLDEVSVYNLKPL